MDSKEKKRTPKQILKDQYARQNEFVKNNYDRISVNVPKGTRDRIKAAIGEGASVNAWIVSLINQELERLEDPGDNQE